MFLFETQEPRVASKGLWSVCKSLIQNMYSRAAVRDEKIGSDLAGAWAAGLADTCFGCLGKAKSRQLPVDLAVYLIGASAVSAVRPGFCSLQHQNR